MATTELPRPTPRPDRAPVLRSVLAGLPGELRANDRRSAALTWILTRALSLALIVPIENGATGDTNYYARSLSLLFHGGSIRDTLQEYPLPVFGLMLPQFLTGAMNTVAFTVLFVLSMLAVDAAFAVYLWRVSGGRRGPALTFWLWFVPLLGPLAYFRFDLVPAVLAGAAVLCAVRRPAWSGALTAVGAALKLWPALLLPIFLIRRVDRSRVIVSFLLVGAGCGLVSLLAGGWDRLISPLSWQKSRGLQIESVITSPLMLGRAIHPHGVWTVTISRFKAWELYGFAVPQYLIASTVLTVLGLVLLGGLWWRVARLPVASEDALGWLFLAAATVITITNKTLSPQYLLWLGGPLAALMVRVPGDRAVLRAARVLLITALLTQLVFPIFYAGLAQIKWYTGLATLLLVARNGLLVYLAWLACRQVWRLTETSAEDELAPAGAATG